MLQGLFTSALSVKVTVKVYRYTNGDGPFNGQIGFRTHSVHQCKFDCDCDFDGDGDVDDACKWTLKSEKHRTGYRIQFSSCQ